MAYRIFALSNLLDVLAPLPVALALPVCLVLESEPGANACGDNPQGVWGAGPA